VFTVVVCYGEIQDGQDPAQLVEVSLVLQIRHNAQQSFHALLTNFEVVVLAFENVVVVVVAP